MRGRCADGKHHRHHRYDDRRHREIDDVAVTFTPLPSPPTDAVLAQRIVFHDSDDRIRSGRYSLPTARSAREVVEHLWHAYLSGHRTSVFPPFGDAVFGGIGFYMGGAEERHYAELARILARRRRRGSSSTAVHLTASPPCSHVFYEQPAALEAMMGWLERLNVRFYNDSMCGYDYHEARPFWGAWTLWSSRFPAATRLHVALPAADGFRGWIDPTTLREGERPSVQDHASYGGLGLWDRYYDKVSGYGRAIRDVV